LLLLLLRWLPWLLLRCLFSPPRRRPRLGTGCRRRLLPLLLLIALLLDAWLSLDALIGVSAAGTSPASSSSSSQHLGEAAHRERNCQTTDRRRRGGGL
jgi:hypothetical protein